MKTWEMIKEITENPDWKFKRISDGLIIKAEQYFLNTKYELIWESGHEKIALEDDWEKVKLPVPFIDAIEEYSEGNSIYCIIDNEKYIYIPPKTGNKSFISIFESDGTPITTDEILRGKWYVE